MVTTWSRKLNYRNVEKEGNDADQSELEDKNYERRRKVTKKRKAHEISAAIDTIIPDVTMPHTFDP